MSAETEISRPRAKRRKKYAPPLSLHPLVAEEALGALLQVKPRKKPGKKASWANVSPDPSAKQVAATPEGRP